MGTSGRFTHSSSDAIPAIKPLRPRKGLSVTVATPPGLRGFVVSTLKHRMVNHGAMEFPEQP